MQVVTKHSLKSRRRKTIHHESSQKGSILVQGAQQNNLQNLTVRIPHDAVTVITGVSGSGKSSLAFDTLFAEGQWRYLESLSTYTRMFIERLDRPKVESLANIRPAIALEQKNTVRTARSTVGTATEILDHLRLLFAKVGRPICPNCQQEARAYSPQTVVDHLLEEGKGARALLLFPIECLGKGQGKAFVESLLRRGFVRLLCGEELVQLDGPSVRLPKHFQDSFVVLDRVVLRPDNRSRIVEGVETAFREGGGYCRVDVIEKRTYWYSSEVECAGCGMRFWQIRPILFSFNHPLGACPECKGFGNVLKYDERLVVPHPLRSIRDGAIEPWTKPATAWWQRQLLRAFQRRNIDPAIPYAHLSEDIRTWIWEGGQRLEGINAGISIRFPF